METRDLVRGSRRDVSLGKNQDCGFRHGIGYGNGLVLAESRELDLGMQYVYGHEFDLSNVRERSWIDENDVTPLQVNNRQLDEEDEDEDGDELNLDSNEHVGAHETDITDDHLKLDLLDTREFDGSIELHVNKNREISVVPTSEFDIQEPVVFLSPGVQSRAIVLAPNPNHDLYVGQEFPDVQSCRRALRDTAIFLHFEIQTVKSDKNRFTAKCASRGCPWRIHTAKLAGVPTFTIRTLDNNHTCSGSTHLGHQQATVQWVANTVEQRLRENPNYKPKEILEEIHRVHGIALSYKQAWRGKERIMASVRGSFEEGYRILPQYAEQIQLSNPGSVAAVYGSPEDNSFQRLFVSYQASIYGFINGCRPLLGLDRISLKSKYVGTLLLATGFDGDGGLFPLAFGVVEEETDDNWMWFLSELRKLLKLNIEDVDELTFLSNRKNGIVDGVEANFPTAFHGFCMRHLSENFRKEFNDTMLVNLFWEAARALTINEFETKILEIQEVSADAVYWIRRIPPRLWATPYFEGTRLGHLTAIMVESLHNWVSEASGLPIIQMMESIRRQLMTWFNERREASMRWTSTLVPYADRLVEDAIELAQSYQVLRANESEFEVISYEGTNIVDIRNRCCLCHGWQAHGLPCSHAVAALLFCRQNIYRHAENCFTVATYRKAYSQTIHPIPDKSQWEESCYEGNTYDHGSEIIMKPPKSVRPPPRPRKKRARADERGSVKRVVHCSRCNQSGHFRTTCAAPI